MKNYGNAAAVARPLEVKDLANPTFLTLPVRLNVGDAIRHVRSSARRGHIFYLYVTDEKNCLCGIVSIRNLLVASDRDELKDVMSKDVVSLPGSTPLAQAYAHFAKSRFLSLPVTSGNGEIIGVVNAHELIEYGKTQDELFEERSRGELFELLGIKAENAQKSAPQVAWSRFPWLLVNVIGGTLSAIFIHFLGGKIEGAVAFLAFVPVLLIIAESVGMQTASVIIANLHRVSSQIKLSSVLGKELVVAFLLGLMCGVPLAGAVYLWSHSTPLAFAVGLTLPFGATWVCALGGFVPTLFHRMRIDPRIAAGPVLLAIADCTTLLLYLSLALGLTRL